MSVRKTIGIGGPSYAGKLTIAQAISAEVSSTIVLMEWIEQAGVCPRKTLVALKQGLNVQLCDIELVPAKNIILVGKTALADNMRDVLDVKIYVDCEPDVSLIRMIRGYGVCLGELLDRYERVIKPFMEQYVYDTKHNATIVVPNNGCDGNVHEMVAVKLLINVLNTDVVL